MDTLGYIDYKRWILFTAIFTVLVYIGALVMHKL